MVVTPYKTNKIIPGNTIFNILDTYLPPLSDKSVVAITSKIISICQKDVIPVEDVPNEKELIRKTAQYYYEDDWLDRFGILLLTIQNGILVANAGIDQSNGNGHYILWPTHLQETTNSIWNYLKKRDKLANLGVIVTDSRISPLRWGTLGVALSYCGFKPLKSYMKTPDIFGKTFKVTQANVVDSLAVAAVGVMGEGSEQTPLAVINDHPLVEFIDHSPTTDELATMQIAISEDMYAPLLQGVKWKKGSGK